MAYDKAIVRRRLQDEEAADAEEKSMCILW